MKGRQRARLCDTLLCRTSHLGKVPICNRSTELHSLNMSEESFVFSSPCIGQAEWLVYLLLLTFLWQSSVKWVVLHVPANGCEYVSYQLSHVQTLHHLPWHAELLLTHCAASGAEKHIQFTTLISLTQSISRPVSHPAHHPVIQAAGLPFLEHFRWVFGCEWALGMRFEEDYQGPESCLGAPCAFQHNCCRPCCISVGKMRCVSFPLPLCVSLIR